MRNPTCCTVFPALLSKPVVGIGMASGLGLLKKAGQAAPEGGDWARDVKEVLEELFSGVPKLEEDVMGDTKEPLKEPPQARREPLVRRSS